MSANQAPATVEVDVVSPLETFDRVFVEVFGAPAATNQDGVELTAVRPPAAARA